MSWRDTHFSLFSGPKSEPLANWTNSELESATMKQDSSLIARREFLKFVAASPYVAAAGGIGAMMAHGGDSGAPLAALTGLLMIIDGADAAPTADAQTAAEKWEAAGADTLARWKAVEADVVTVNAALEKAKLKPLPK